MRGDKLIINDNHRKAAGDIFKILLPRLKNADGKYVITIAGESGSGKSEIAAVLAESLSQNGFSTLILQQDDYFVYPPKTNAQKRIEDIARVGTSEVRLDVLDDNLADIIAGKNEIEKPLVIFEEDRIISELLDIGGADIVIVEGTYTTLLKNANMRVFIDRDHNDTREDRKKRGREVQDEFLEKVLDIEHKIISSHKDKADVIVSKNYSAKEVKYSNGC